MKQLFAVEVEATLYAIADDDSEAEKIIQSALDSDRYARDDVASGALLSAYEVVHPKHHLGVWRDSIPYGEEQDRTCQQVLDEWLEWERTRPRTQAELEAAGQLRLTDVL